MLEFDQVFRNKENLVSRNLQNLFEVNAVPSDSALRKRLDELDPVHLRPAFKKLFSMVQRGKVLEEYTYIDGHHLLSLDGTGYYSSKTVSCAHCCEKHHRDGSTTYYHQMLCGAIVSPDQKEVIPLAPEPIFNTDGATCCERNASRRFLEDFRREHPHLKTIILEDGLASNAPHIRQLAEKNLRYILGAKPGDHTFLFQDLHRNAQTQEQEMETADGTHHRFLYLNNVPLNASNPDVTVNVLEYYGTKPATKTRPKPTRFSWVTDLPLEEQTLMQIMRAGRARWRIENETINALKNQGYHFEHNFGHGHKYLSTVFAFLMFLAFLVDQIEMRCDGLFRTALEKMGRLKYFREHVRHLFRMFILESWEFLYQGMTKGFKMIVHIDSS